MNAFQLTLPRQVRFGWGVREELGSRVASLARRVWVVAGSRTLVQSGVIDALLDDLRAHGVATELLTTVTREPLVRDVDDAARSLLQMGGAPGDALIAVGGGSAIDLAKAVAAMATNRHGSSVQDYLEGVGRGLVLEHQPLPVVALPTTAGTGSEATRNAVISSLDPPFKKSLRSDRIVPGLVLLDPELTVSCPPHVTAHSGMDAVTQLIESLLSRRANPFTSALCLEGLAHAIPALPRAVADGADHAAREAMMYAAFLSGMALANSGLGLAHGVAAALGVHCGVPHGLGCAVMLPHAMRFNRETRRNDLARLATMLRPGAAFADPDAAADSAIAEVEGLCHSVGIPASLRDLGVSRGQLDALVTASHGNSLSGNPRDVSDDDLRALLASLC